MFRQWFGLDDEEPKSELPSSSYQWRWPEDVDLPDQIGRGCYVQNGKPHCATAHFAYTLNPGYPCTALASREHAALDLAFRRAAILITGIEPGKHSALGFNDEVLTDEQLHLAYAAAWAYLGYSISGFPEAARLGLKLRRTYGIIPTSG